MVRALLQLCTKIKKEAPLAGVNASGAGCALFFQETLEVDFSTELQDSRIKRGVEPAKGVGDSRGRQFSDWVVVEANRVVDAVKLCVVPHVEGFKTEFETASTRFSEQEVLCKTRDAN